MDDDYNSLWTIKEPNHEAVKTYCTFLFNKIINLNAEMLSDLNTLSLKEICIPKKYFSR